MLVTCVKALINISQKEREMNVMKRINEIDVSDLTRSDAIEELVILAKCYVEKQEVVNDKKTWIERINKLHEFFWNWLFWIINYW